MHKTRCILILFMSIACLFFSCGENKAVTVEPTGFLSQFTWGMTREDVIRLVDNEKAFTMIYDKITFIKEMRIVDEVDSISLAILFLYDLSFADNGLVAINRAFSDTLIDESFCNELNRVFVDILTEKFGKPFLASESAVEEDGVQTITTMWETKHLMLTLVASPDLKGISMRYSKKGAVSQQQSKTDTVIKNLWFGLVEKDNQNPVQKMRATREIPLDTSIQFALVFDIASKNEVRVTLGQKMPGDVGIMYDPETGEPSPQLDGYYMADMGRYKDSFQAVMSLEEHDPVGIYKIKVFIDDSLTAMIAFDVVHQGT